jgi:hypothetical protein
MLDLLHRTRKTACASLLACVVLGVFAAGASAAAPTFTEPIGGSTIESHVEEEIALVHVKGTSLATLQASISAPLPEGLVLKPVEAETEWVIEGKPKAAKPTTTVTLEATNEGKTATVSVEWIVREALPTLTAPPNETSTVDKPVVVVVTGTNLDGLTAKGLPAGVTTLKKESPTEWKIEGTPSAARPLTNVTLEARHGEGEVASTASVEFKWAVSEAAPTIGATPANQTSTVGTAITPVVVSGSNLFGLSAPALPAGLTLNKVGETEWKIEGAPTIAKAATEVTLEAVNKEGTPGPTVTFKWTVTAAQEPPKIETPSKPPETPSKPPETPKAVSAGRLGTMPTQKQGRELWASFLCEVASCKVQVMATITAGKAKFKLHSVRTPIAQGKKTRIALKLTKKQRALIAAALKKRKKVTAAMSASIDSSVGRQVTKALVVTVKR